MIDRVCPGCGIAFQTYGSYYARKYCTANCAVRAPKNLKGGPTACVCLHAASSHRYGASCRSCECAKYVKVGT